MSNPSPITFPPTPEQAAIIDAALHQKASVMVNAYAGTGKTTTMVMMGKAFPPGEAVLCLAFNRTIADTLVKVMPAHFTIKTFNGIGHSAWGKAIGKRLILDDRKVSRLVSSYFKEIGFQASQEDWAGVRDLVNKAYNLGLVPSEYTHIKGLVPDEVDVWKGMAFDLDLNPKFIDPAREVLRRSVKESFAGTVSFDDQVYMSALFGGIFPRFPKVIVDESQDLSPLNHIQVQRCAADRLFVVGDRKQAIYAFRGADSSSMDKLKLLRKDWIELPLFTTFRCPKAIVARAQAHAPGYTAWKDNAEGTILQLPIIPDGFKPLKDADGEPILPKWKWADVEALGYSDVAVLCRNNAPLLSMAFKLLRRGIGCKVIGRDIGKSLVALAKKIVPEANTNLSDTVTLIGQWRQSEISKAQVMGRESSFDSIHDKAESLLAVAESAMPRNAGELIEKLEALFARTFGTVTLSSGHKSKGLEWDLVVHLDPWRVPSKWAKTPSEIEQEKNLRYVMETRPKKALILANLEDFQ